MVKGSNLEIKQGVKLNFKLHEKITQIDVLASETIINIKKLVAKINKLDINEDCSDLELYYEDKDLDNIKTVAALYAPERVIKGPDYFENIMKDLQQSHVAVKTKERVTQMVK